MLMYKVKVTGSPDSVWLLCLDHVKFFGHVTCELTLRGVSAHSDILRRWLEFRYRSRYPWPCTQLFLELDEIIKTHSWYDLNHSTRSKCHSSYSEKYIRGDFLTLLSSLPKTSSLYQYIYCKTNLSMEKYQLVRLKMKYEWHKHDIWLIRAFI